MNVNSRPVTNRPAAMVYRAVASYLVENDVQCSVLHGIDPLTGDIGTDLDLYVPDQSAAAKIVVHTCKQLIAHAFPWSTAMPPMWGPRCIGVRLDDYCELHILTVLRLGPCDLGRMISPSPIVGALGLPYDPALYFLRQIIKKSRAILGSRPIWTGGGPPEFLLAHQSSIKQALSKVYRDGAAFVTNVLAPDSPSAMAARRRGLLGLMRTQVVTHPVRSAQMVGMYLQRRALRMRTPCVPYVSVATSIPAQRIESELKERLGHAFRGIYVRNEPWSWPVRRWIQARQVILVHATTSEANIDPDAEIRVVLDPESFNCDPFNELTHHILDGLVAKNRKWWSYYASV